MYVIFDEVKKVKDNKYLIKVTGDKINSIVTFLNYKLRMIFDDVSPGQVHFNSTFDVPTIFVWST